MKNTLRYFITTLIIISLAVTTANATSSTDETQSSALNQTTNFLSNVAGLDLTKYSLTTPSYQLRNNTPSTGTVQPSKGALFNPNEDIGVNMESPSYYFKSGKGTLDIMSIFYNGQLAIVNINSIGNNDSYIYLGSSGTDLTNQANDLLTRYATFISQQSATSDTSFLTRMKNVLNSVNIESSTNITTCNTNFQSSQNGNRTRLQWIYTEDGIVMNWKRVEMDFNNNNLVSFQDTWSLYKVAGLSAVSSQQATKIALDAAQKVTLDVTNSAGQNITVKTPALSNARYDVRFNMLPYSNSSANFPSKISRDPLTLYPYWQFHFYFKQTFAGDEGIQVGVWGDTSEVIYASPFGYLGDLTTASSDTSSTDANSLGLVFLIAFIVAVILAVCVPVALRRKIRQRH